MDQASEVREKIDLVSFISDYIPLKKAGRNFKANCPFHNEKTPSFVISPERQIWHCFGCGKGGDAFTFLMEYENMEFSEALRSLAKKTGVVLKESEFRKKEYSEKDKIFELNNLALKFYNYLLLNHNIGKKALSYLLEERKIAKGLIESFELGFAPHSGFALSEYLIKKKGFQKKDLILAGLSFEKGAKAYDFFRGRIMFPLIDHRGNITGFSGRGLEDFDTPKYLNTKETSVYHKGNMFFGLNKAKDEIKEKNEAIIVEGEFDAISLFSENIKNVVAIKGTALTENQVILLSRFTQKLTLCLDQDDAGFEATKRSLEVIEKKGLTTDVIVLKEVKDPDEAIKKDPIGFKKSLKEKINVYDFVLSKFESEFNSKTVDGKKEISQKYLPLVANISNEIVKEHYLKKLSNLLDISLESLSKEMEKLSSKKEEENIIVPTKDKKTRRELLEEYAMSLIIQSEKIEEILKDFNVFVKEYKFEKGSLEKILRQLFQEVEKGKRIEIKIFSKRLTKELIEAFDTCYLFPIPKFDTEEKYKEELKKVLDELLSIYIKSRITELSDEIRDVEKNKKNSESLRKEFTKLLALLPKS